ncbi:hypothetical protein NDU88_003932 [Pleurodeles waltl]|uniref:Uncharacterized protein n=1 Tax=Pleurodeles waltl TaxID=8319 RepID=A0AAV7SHG1_PLEWA|nr:hypothetical protein NDU88_003932 [Pleurodeles waltl]
MCRPRDRGRRGPKWRRTTEATFLGLREGDERRWLLATDRRRSLELGPGARIAWGGPCGSGVSDLSLPHPSSSHGRTGAESGLLWGLPRLDGRSGCATRRALGPCPARSPYGNPRERPCGLEADRGTGALLPPSPLLWDGNRGRDLSRDRL